MLGVELSEHDHFVVITIDTNVIDRARIDELLTYLVVPEVGFVDDQEQADLDPLHDSLTDDDRKTVHTERVRF